MVAENANVSVVILTRNSASTIEQCVRSVLNEEPREVLAVDFLSEDRTIKMLQQYDVKILFDPVGSKGYARQMGVEAATGSYVMFVDSDVELAPKAIRRLREQLEKNGWVRVHTQVLSAEKISPTQEIQDEFFRG